MEQHFGLYISQDIGMEGYNHKYKTNTMYYLQSNYEYN